VNCSGRNPNGRSSGRSPPGYLGAPRTSSAWSNARRVVRGRFVHGDPAQSSSRFPAFGSERHRRNERAVDDRDAQGRVVTRPAPTAVTSRRKERPPPAVRRRRAVRPTQVGVKVDSKHPARQCPFPLVWRLPALPRSTASPPSTIESTASSMRVNGIGWEWKAGRSSVVGLMASS